MNNFLPPPAFMLIFIVIVIRFCDRIDFGVSHVKGVVSNFMGIHSTVAQQKYKLHFRTNFINFYRLFEGHNDNNIGVP